MICGSIFSATSPPIIDPLPRPAAREAQRAAAAAPNAREVLAGTRAGLGDEPERVAGSGMGRVCHRAPGGGPGLLGVLSRP
ncbi:hypothetical protein GCM10009624_28930 [Gordonia sinesedis]